MAKTLDASLIHSHIDYTNSVIHVSTNIKRLQSVQNSVAIVVLSDYSHRPAGDLSQLHWLSVQNILQDKLSHV